MLSKMRKSEAGKVTMVWPLTLPLVVGLMAVTITVLVVRSRSANIAKSNWFAWPTPRITRDGESSASVKM